MSDAWPLLQRLAALSGGLEVRRLAAARVLAALSETEATTLLADVLRLAGQREAEAMAGAAAFLQALDADGERIPHLGALRQVAVLYRQSEVEALFTEGDAVSAYSADAAARADARLFSQPLGVLKTRARLTDNPDELSRLAVVSNPAVVREVLRNPRLTEALVVRIAARRPARPEPLAEIWRSTRWSVRAPVRRALVFNPYLMPDVGVKIVPLLPRVDLEQVRVAASLHPSLRALASELLLPQRGS